MAPLALLAATTLHAEGVAKFQLAGGPLELSGPVNPWRFINAVGEKSGLWGYENGHLEGWVYPLKIFHDFNLTFQLEGLARTYEGDQIARSVRVYPHAVQLQYAAEQFSVEETLFAPRHDAGFVILLDVHAPRALSIRARFRPDLNLMWPGGIGGQSAGWDAEHRRMQLTEASGRFSALIGSPMAVDSTAIGYHAYLSDQQPYEEIGLRITPEDVRDSYVPIVVTGGIRDIYDAADTYRALLRELPKRYEEARAHYAGLDSTGTQFSTPDPAVNDALRWSRVALEQLKVCNPYVGCSYVSGYGSSGTGTRPMYAWFFDEPDATVWAFLASGQVEQLREGFRFIRKYQRADGKIPHEVSQSAGVIDWFKDYPYAYIHPDSPLWYLIAMGQFYRATGDRGFIQESWTSVRKAYEYCVSILDPSDDLPTIPKGEWGSMETAAYRKDSAMGAEWIHALQAMAEISATLGDEKLAAECASRRQKATVSLDRFWNSELNFYNYGVDKDGRPVTNLNPTIGFGAWFGSLPDERARTVVERLATASFLTDWGQRNMSLEDPRYQEGDYQTGSVWPFMTIGPMLADYRYHNPVQGFLTWMAMIRLRQFNSRGNMPEVLSGASYRLLDNSVPHQMFSESTVIPGFVNGVLGLESDVPHRSLRLTPHVPPGWPECSVQQFPYGSEKLGVSLRQQPGVLSADVQISGPEAVTLEFAPALPMGAEPISVEQDGKPLRYRVDQHASDLHVVAQTKATGRSRIEVHYRGGVAIDVVWQPLLEGDGSCNLRVLRSSYTKPSVEFLVEGRPDRPYEIRLFTPWRIKENAALKIVSADDQVSVVAVSAPTTALSKMDKAGYVRWTVRVEFVQLRARGGG